MTANNQSLVFAHIGDLHLTDAREQNYKDFLSIIAAIENNCASNIDMVYLPGDNADHGHPHSYRLLSTALKMLSVPVYAITGDHDMEPHHLDNFYAMPAMRVLPFAVNIKNRVCLFLDICGNGSGGPDFRLGEKQLQRLGEEANKASIQGLSILLFMHSFPEDLKDPMEKQAVNNIIQKHNVLLVAMGHTHYNEIANDGNTLFTATRSTGQIEEGPVGFSLVSVCKNAVSWRFKLLDEPFPFIMITYPADYRLSTRQSQQHTLHEIRAIVMADKKMTSVDCRINNGNWIKMSFSKEDNCWLLPIHFNQEQPAKITVMAKDETGRPGLHSIAYSPTLKKAATDHLKAGSDAFSIGAWTENHIMGTQLGPNRNSKPIK